MSKRIPIAVQFPQKYLQEWMLWLHIAPQYSDAIYNVNTANGAPYWHQLNIPWYVLSIHKFYFAQDCRTSHSFCFIISCKYLDHHKLTFGINFRFMAKFLVFTKSLYAKYFQYMIPLFSSKFLLVTNPILRYRRSGTN